VTLLKVAKKDREGLLRANAIVSLGYLLRDEEVVEFLTETFRTGVPREQAAAAIAMGLSREEEWLVVLDPGSVEVEEGEEAPEPLDLEDEVAEAVEAAKQVLSDGGLTPLARPVVEIAEDELRRERLFGGRSGGGRGGEEGGRGGGGGGRGGGGGGRGGGGEDPEDQEGSAE
jgi:uncharacterized membrane protein YgcG